MSKLVYNAIRTPDGTVIESTFRHDYVSHKDKNGKTYAVDGGHAYARRIGAMDYDDVSLTTDDPHAKIREYFKWGTYGKDGDEEFHRILLKDMEKGHIQAIINDESYSNVHDTLNDELTFRLT